MTDPGSLLPVYVAVDVSASMESGALAEIDRVLAEILQSAREVNELANRLRVGYIQFADAAHVLLPVPDFPDLAAFPPTSFGGTTNPAALFTLLTSLIVRDVDRLARSGARVCRPVVLLLTDGQFGAGWEPCFRDLTEYDPLTSEGFPCYPFVVPIGVGDRDPDVLRLVAHPPFIAGLAENAHGGEGAVLATLGDLLSASFVDVGPGASAGIHSADDFV